MHTPEREGHERRADGATPQQAPAGRDHAASGPAGSDGGFQAGDLVRVRGRTWRVEAVWVGEDCSALKLATEGPEREPARRTLLVPFDRPVPMAARTEPRVVSRRRWCWRLGHLLAQRAARGLASAVRDASIEWLPYQLEPALALVSGLANRVLVADHVGLGKTIEAGLALLLLRSRHVATRVLCLVPAGLRPQWQAELRERFGIDAPCCDAAWLTRRVAELPAGVNPWSLPGVYLASHDYVKRADVLPAFEGTTWDLLIVDEAHVAAPENERSEAIEGLARRALRVLLLSATPHDGDDRRFRRLCTLGQLDGADGLAVFRRTRRDLGLVDSPRQCVLAVTPSAAERHVHELLGRYRAAVERETGQSARLAMLVLHKRALSAPFALWRSVVRRLSVLGSEATQVGQLALPLTMDSTDDLDDLPDDVLAVPGLASAARERAWLNALAHAARAAVPCDRKLAALDRLVRRVVEPLLIFTEYRDTLAHLERRLSRRAPVAVLHGGQSPDQREAVLAAFSQRRARVLIATDVAAQGLNLQHTCRAVVTLELPWNPNRLEQRVGRVHRHGQARRCHAVHLVGRGTDEEQLARRLALRVGSIRRALGDSGVHLGGLEAAFTTGLPAHDDAPQRDERLLHIDLAVEAGALATSLRAIRAARRWTRTSRSRRRAGEDAPLLSSLRWRPSPAGRRAAPRGTSQNVHDDEGAIAGPSMVPGRGVVLVYHLDVTSAAGNLLESSLDLMHLDVPVPGWPGTPDAGDLRAFAGRTLADAASALDAALGRRRDEALASARARWARAVEADGTRLARMREQAQRRLAGHLAQPGLFDGAPWQAQSEDPDGRAPAWPSPMAAPSACQSRLELVLVVRPSGGAERVHP